MRMKTALLCVAVMCSGCAAVLTPALLLDAVVGSASIYQRWEDRKTQQEQTAEIKALRLEIQRLRERMP